MDTGVQPGDVGDPPQERIGPGRDNRDRIGQHPQDRHPLDRVGWGSVEAQRRGQRRHRHLVQAQRPGQRMGRKLVHPFAATGDNARLWPAQQLVAAEQDQIHARPEAGLHGRLADDPMG